MTDRLKQRLGETGEQQAELDGPPLVAIGVVGKEVDLLLPGW
jgi:hypothetical protein